MTNSTNNVLDDLALLGELLNVILCDAIDKYANVCEFAPIVVQMNCTIKPLYTFQEGNTIDFKECWTWLQ